jgi:hypothetical protein
MDRLYGKHVTFVRLLNTANFTLTDCAYVSASQCQAFRGQCFFQRQAPAKFPALPSVSFDI